jgi:hypothetical protein
MPCHAWSVPPSIDRPTHLTTPHHRQADRANNGGPARANGGGRVVEQQQQHRYSASQSRGPYILYRIPPNKTPTHTPPPRRRSAAAAAAAAAAAGGGGGFDEGTRKTVQKIPLLRTRAGPRDGEQWQARLREELQALIAFVKMNKEADNDWYVWFGAEDQNQTVSRLDTRLLARLIPRASAVVDRPTDAWHGRKRERETTTTYHAQVPYRVQQDGDAVDRQVLGLPRGRAARVRAALRDPGYGIYLLTYSLTYLLT